MLTLTWQTTLLRSFMVGGKKGLNHLSHRTPHSLIDSSFQDSAKADFSNCLVWVTFLSYIHLQHPVALSVLTFVILFYSHLFTVSECGLSIPKSKGWIFFKFVDPEYVRSFQDQQTLGECLVRERQQLREGAG